MKADEPRQNRIPFMMSDAELAAIDEWRFANKIATRAEAIRRLCQIALTLEPLAMDLMRLWRAVQSADAKIGGSMIDAWANIDSLPTEENFRAMEAGVDELVPASLELGIHATLMAEILDALKSGQTLETSIADMKKRVREREGTRRFVRDAWGPKT